MTTTILLKSQICLNNLVKLFKCLFIIFNTVYNIDINDKLLNLFIRMEFNMHDGTLFSGFENIYFFYY